MRLSEKVKIVLEETRILILGAQILLGFGFRGVFSERFDELPEYARYADGVGLGLLVCTVGLLIAPGPYHRIVEGGQDSGQLHRFVTAIADLALLPFALALGLGLFVGTEGIFDDAAVSTAAEVIGAGLALVLWYGLPQLRKGFVGGAGTNDRARPIERAARHAAAGQDRTVADGGPRHPARRPGSVRLSAGHRAYASLRAVAEGLGRRACGEPVFGRASRHDADGAAPYHRIVYAGEDTEDMYRVGSALVMGATLPLGLGLAGDIYVVIAKISGSFAIGSLTGALAFVLLTGLWYLYPIIVARRGR
jgi:hypothetical protein